ncbi:MAG: aminotransferase class I/II-fold pyridoxal phosphate-dependent enzyme [Clostridia bacterium]|nr:aminotransferase class I/II-fold pyridoxal phosphate-dependent enzyme [Clostridia bacterium]
MLSFASDYVEGAHPAILQRFIETNLVKQAGYGSDEYTASAREKIKAACGCPEADVWFLTGGTQTNQVVIDSLLLPYEGVVAAETGHIAAHEAGAIEFTGHKVLTVPHRAGKMAAADLSAYLATYHADDNAEHMVRPGAVYISHPTEYGTLYTKEELTALRRVCDEYEIPLFMDGARLGYGLAAPDADLTLHDLCDLCDVFYIGGTKVGALCGEAVVFARRKAPRHFLSIIKQHGALVAKGRLLGIQFDTLFTDDLYMRISRHAIEMAELMRSIFRAKGYEFFMETTTNQIFITLPDDRKAELEKECVLSFWEKPDPDHTVVRFATSWATAEEDIRALEAIL